MLVEDTRQPERQPILLKRMQDKIYKTKKQMKDLGTKTHPSKEVVREKFPNRRKPSQR